MIETSRAYHFWTTGSTKASDGAIDGEFYLVFGKKYENFLKLHFGLEPTCKRSPSQRLCESNHEERSTTRRKTIVFDQKWDLYEKGAKRGQMMPNCTGINLDYRRKSQFLVMATCTTPLKAILPWIARRRRENFGIFTLKTIDFVKKIHENQVQNIQNIIGAFGDGSF